MLRAPHLTCGVQVPLHDVVVTNPPYTGDHVERLLRFLLANGKPLFVLMPNYFGDDGSGRGQGLGTPRQRQNWVDTLGDGRLQPVLLCPRERYQYWTPESLRRVA